MFPVGLLSPNVHTECNVPYYIEMVSALVIRFHFDISISLFPPYPVLAKFWLKCEGCKILYFAKCPKIWILKFLFHPFSYEIRHKFSYTENLLISFYDVGEP